MSNRPEEDHTTDPRCAGCTFLEVKIETLKGKMEEINQDKDRRISEMHGDLLGVRAEVRKLAEGLQTTNEALTVIAQNTTIMAKMAELVEVYDNLKGFGWVMKNFGFLGVLIVGVAAGAFTALKMAGVI